MKRKIIIFPGNFLPNVGGLETHVDEFVKYLPKNKYDITIFTPLIQKSQKFEILHRNVKIIRYPAVWVTANFPMPQFWNPKFWIQYFKLYSKKYDVVMTRTRFFTNSTLGMIFAKFRFKKIKLIHVEHGSQYVKLTSQFKSNIALIYDKTFGKMLFYFADKSIAISQVSYDFVKKEFIRNSEIPIIKRGVDFDLYKSIKLNKNIRNKYKDKVIVGSLSRLYKWKGVENSIKAFKELPIDIKKKAIFLIVGDGEDLIRLKEIAKDEKNIIFLGGVNFSKAISLLKSFDIFIHSSYPGGALSNSLLQALYCGCAVVASPNEGASEVVFNKKTGVLLENNSSKEIKMGIIKLVKDKNLRVKLGNNSKKYIEENFSWKNVVEKYENIFDEVLKK